MPFKIVISEKSLAYKLETEANSLIGKSLGEKFDGRLIKPELEGYEFEISGGSDISGFPMSKNLEGIGLKKMLLKKGWGMHDKRKGVRLKKTIRGKTISEKTSQINLIVKKEGKSKLSELFPDQNKPKEEKQKEAQAPAN